MVSSSLIVNPAFFCGANRDLLTLVRGLGREGILRLDGGASEYITGTGEENAGGAPSGIFGPDTCHHAKVETLTTPLLSAT